MRTLMVFIAAIIPVMAACSADDQSDFIETTAAPEETVAEAQQELSTCGSGLICAASPVTGATGCMQNNGNPNPVYCCPSGYSFAGGSCIPTCGSGLSCGYSATAVTGASICSQNNGNVNPGYCCPPGKTFSASGCY